MNNFTGFSTFILRQAQEVDNPYIELCQSLELWQSCKVANLIYLVFEIRKLKFV